MVSRFYNYKIYTLIYNIFFSHQLCHCIQVFGSKAGPLKLSDKFTTIKFSSLDFREDTGIST